MERVEGAVLAPELPLAPGPDVLDPCGRAVVTLGMVAAHPRVEAFRLGVAGVHVRQEEAAFRQCPEQEAGQREAAPVLDLGQPDLPGPCPRPGNQGLVAELPPAEKALVHLGSFF